MFKRLTVSLLVLTMIMVSFPTGSILADDSKVFDEKYEFLDKKSSRSYGSTRTQFLPNLSDSFFVPYKENLVQRKDGYVKLNDKVVSQMRSLTASEHSTYQRSTSRIAQNYHGMVFVCFITDNVTGGGGIDFKMMTFDDLGVPLEGPFVVGKASGTTKGSVDLRIHQDKIFLTMVNGGFGSYELRIKVCHYLDWKNLSSIQGQNLQSGFEIQQTSIVDFQDSLIVFWSRAGSDRPYYRVYNNGSWSSTMNIGINMERIATTFNDMNGIDTVYMYYVPTSTRNEIHVMNTTNIGQTWSGSTVVKTYTQEIEHISLVSGDDKVHIAVSYDQLDTIRYFTHSAEGTDDEMNVADYTPNVQDGDPREISISSVGEDIFIMNEETGGKVTLNIIRDGPYPIETISFGNGMAHSPALGCGMSAICFINGTNLEIRTMGEAGSGLMYLYPVSPVGLSSWDDVGFNTGGLTDTASISFRILDWKGGSQLYPETGYHDIGTSGPGIIEPNSYTNKVDLTGEWTSGTTIVPSIIMEIRFQREREDGEDPWLMDACINFTNSYPYRDELTEDLHVAASMNCDVTPIGIKMIEGADDAWAIIGPVEFEAVKPDHFSVLGGFLGGENMIRAEVLDPEWEVVPGFGSESSTVVTTEDIRSYIKWGDLNLHDLPPMLDTIYVRVEMEKVNAVEPAVKWIEFSGSTAPSITGSMVVRNSIYRGGQTTLSIEVMDGEEPPEDLLVEIQYMHSDTGIWQDTLVSEGLWTGSSWEFAFSTDMDTKKGDYTFRSSATDGVGQTTDWTELGLGITVKNNLPKPPRIAVDPPVARVGDPIAISTIFDGTDKETSSEELRYRIELYRNEILFQTFENITTLELNLEDLYLVKHENWTIKAKTWDGEDLSPSFDTWFMVENTGPVITSQLPDSIVMVEDTPLTLEDPGSWLFDADGDELEVLYTASSGIGVSMEGDDVVLTPETDLHGTGWVQMDFSDGEFDGSVMIPVEIEPVNDVPLYNPIEQVKVKQGRWTYIDIGAFDPSDLETLDISFDFLDVIPDLEIGRNIFFYPNGSIRIKASNEMVGFHNVTCTIQDSEHVIITYIDIEVIDVNDRPSIDHTTTSDHDSVYFFGDEITLVGEAHDIDEAWGDLLSYTWSSDKDGVLGDGKELTVSLTTGTHTIKLEVTDSRGGYNSTQFDLTVVAAEKEAGTVMRTSTLFLLSGFVAFLIGLIIAIIIVIISVLRRKKNEKKEDEQKEPVKGPEELKETDKPELSPGTSEERQLPPATSMPENVIPQDTGPTPGAVQEPKLEEPTPQKLEEAPQTELAGASPPDQEPNPKIGPEPPAQLSKQPPQSNIPEGFKAPMGISSIERSDDR